MKYLICFLLSFIQINVNGQTKIVNTGDNKQAINNVHDDFVPITSEVLSGREHKHREISELEDSVRYPILEVWQDTIPVLAELYVRTNPDTTLYTISKQTIFEVCKRIKRIGCACWPDYVHLEYLDLHKRYLYNVRRRLDQ